MRLRNKIIQFIISKANNVIIMNVNIQTFIYLMYFMVFQFTSLFVF